MDVQARWALPGIKKGGRRTMIFTCKNMYHLEWQKIIRLLQFHLKKHSANISILSENTHFLLILKTERLNFAPSLSARIELWILRKLEKDKQTNKLNFTINLSGTWIVRKCKQIRNSILLPEAFTNKSALFCK